MSGTAQLMLLATFLPLLGGFGLLFVPNEKRDIFQKATVAIMAASFLLSVPLWFLYDRGSDAVQFAYSCSWMPSLGVKFSVGMDGISLLPGS